MAKVGIMEVAASRLLTHMRTAMFSLQRKLSSWTSAIEPGFFDSYPRFFITSKTRAEPNRLNHRHRALIESNESIIRGKSVLDIASHDGRWSFAAHKAGACHVLGIEARPYLVEHAQANLRAYEVPEDQVRFVIGDVFREIDRLEPGTFETVFCFGFFYHTMHHMLLLSKIARLRPEHVIFDTLIDLDPGSIIEVSAEDVEIESAGAVSDADNSTRLVIGRPTKSALELMLSTSGFTFSYYDWHRAGVKRWDALMEYHVGKRVTLVATRSHQLTSSVPSSVHLL